VSTCGRPERTDLRVGGMLGISCQKKCQTKRRPNCGRFLNRNVRWSIRDLAGNCNHVGRNLRSHSSFEVLRNVAGFAPRGPVFFRSRHGPWYGLRRDDPDHTAQDGPE